MVWSYGSLQEGPTPLKAPYVIPQTSMQDVDIEPFLARQAALQYLDRFNPASVHPFEIAKLEGKTGCVGLISYCAYLTGTLGRGTLQESRKVMVGLLMEDTES